MIFSLGLIFVLGFAGAWLCQKIRIPGLAGMIGIGLLIGPYGFNWIDGQLLEISAALRRIALIMILIKAGLSLDLQALKKAGRSAILMSFVPASFEMIAFIVLAPVLLSITPVEAALMGAVMAAVSPAVVTPRMVKLIEEGRGNEHSIPQMILAGASCDDIYVMIWFSSFLSMNQGGLFEVTDLIQIPIEIGLGALVGCGCGFVLTELFRKMESRKPVSSSLQTVVILGVSFLLSGVEEIFSDIVPFSGLLAIVTMASIFHYLNMSPKKETLKKHFGDLWNGAEILLFVLVGATINPAYLPSFGWVPVILIGFGLLVRSIGVWICLIRTPLTKKEKIFSIIAYTPKATVQAAIGAIPLTMGLACGPLILTTSVLAILITAPLGALAMDTLASRLLIKE